MTGIVRGYEVKKNRDGSQNVLMLQVEISGPDDNQSVEYMSHAGDDHIPPIGSVVTILTAGKSWKIAIASNDTIDFDSSLKEGDRKLYSKNNASFIKILSDGTIELNGNADFAVAFNDLKAGFDAFVGTFNSHVHTSGGSGSPTTTPTVPSTDNIDASKIATVKVP